MKTNLIPLAAWERVTDAQRLALVSQLFIRLEYASQTIEGSDGPGAADHRSDPGEIVDEVFAEYGIRFTPTGMDRPRNATYQFTGHNMPNGDWCPWSHCAVAEPHERSTPGDLRCPAWCPDSTIEYGPRGSATAGS